MICLYLLFFAGFAALNHILFGEWYYSYFLCNSRMLGSNGELSERQWWFPKTIINFRKFGDGRYSCWASGALWLQHWTALGSSWAGTVCVHSLMFLLLCVSIHISISGNSINSVFDNPFYEGLFHELSVPLGMGDRTWWKGIRTGHFTPDWSSYLYLFN